MILLESKLIEIIVIYDGLCKHNWKENFDWHSSVLVIICSFAIQGDILWVQLQGSLFRWWNCIYAQFVQLIAKTLNIVAAI